MRLDQFVDPSSQWRPEDALTDTVKTTPRPQRVVATWAIGS